MCLRSALPLVRAVLPDGRQSLFAISNLLAAMLGLVIAFEASMPRPWFVLLTVYVTAQPMSGAIRPKVMHRLAGLAVGSAVTILLVPNLQNSPELLVLCLAAWSGLCVYLAVLDRSPRATLFQMAGFASTVISFPFVNDPSDIFDTTIDRVEEAALAILCTVAVHTLLRPWDTEAALRQRAASFLRHARRWAGQVLGDRPDRLENDLRRQLAGDVTELGMIAFHLPPGAGRGRIGAGQVASLQHDLADLLPIAADIAARIDDLRATGAIPSSFEDLVRDVREWIAAPEPAAAPALRTRCAAFAREDRAGWEGLLASGIALRLDRLIEVLAHAGRQAQFLPQDAPPAPAPALPGDHGVAALAGLAMASAILLYCAAWILLAWPNGATMAAFAAIITGSFAAQDDPAPAIDRYLVATLKTYPLSAFILFVVLPRIDGYAMLMLAIAPPLLWMGYIQADPRRSPQALPMFSCFIVALNLQPRFANDFAVFANTACAQLAGIMTTLVITRLFRSTGVVWTARRLLRSNAADLADLADRGRPLRMSAWTVHALDRMGQVAQRLALAARGERLGTADALLDLRVGPRIIGLRHGIGALPAPVEAHLGRVLTILHAWYRRRSRRGHAQTAPVALRMAIDRALHAILTLPTGTAQRPQVASDLVGLRCALFPAAPPPVFAPDVPA